MMPKLFAFPKALEELRLEITSLRSALEREAERAREAEATLRDTRATVEALEIARNEFAEQIRQVEDAALSTRSIVAELKDQINDLVTRNAGGEKTSALMMQRLLKLERQTDQQAHDVQAAVSGLVIRIEDMKRTGVSS
jgi:septation ring formation regulator EzrA